MKKFRRAGFVSGKEFRGRAQVRKPTRGQLSIRVFPRNGARCNFVAGNKECKVFEKPPFSIARTAVFLLFGGKKALAQRAKIKTKGAKTEYRRQKTEYRRTEGRI